LAAKEGFTLLSAVPDDVFFCVASRHNPERDFLDKYWNEVMEALKASGVGADALALISGVGSDAQQAEMERLKERMTQLIDGVDWTALCGGEFVFGERWSALIHVKGNVALGPPDMAFLIKGVPGSTAKNYEGLVAILDGIAGEVNGLAGQEALVVEKETKAQSSTAKIDVLRMVKGAPALPLAVTRHGDVIAITVGTAMQRDVLSLLEGAADVKSIGASPRFKEAFAKLPPAEDEMSFFDMTAMLKFHRNLVKTLLQKAPEDAGDVMINAHLSKEADAIANKGLAAYREDDFAKALELTEKAHEVAPKDSRIMYNLACFHARLGHQDKALAWLRKAVDAGFYSPKMILNDSDLEAVRTRPEFDAAVASAKKHAGHEAKADVEQWAKLAQRLIDVPDVIDHIATVSYTDGYSVHSEQFTALEADASTAPIYPVFGNRKPIDKFARYLPKESASFSVGTGFDWMALYAFLEETLQDVKIEGQSLWAMWESAQRDAGVDVRNDVLKLIRGDYASVTMRDEGGEASVLLLGVTDETAAAKKLAEVLDTVTKKIPELAKQNPMLAMWAVRAAPTEREALPGFFNIQVGMMPEPAVAGVMDGYLILGSSATAVEYCLATAKGEHPSVRKNETIMAELILPTGPFNTISYTDKRKLGEQVAQGLGMFGMFGGMATMAIPDPKFQKVATKILEIIGKLGPVARKLDFYKSEASVESFDGNGWHKRSVTNYRSPKERVAARAPRTVP